MNRFTAKKVFLLDFFGASLSALFLAFLSKNYEYAIGIPSETLYFLMLFPCVFIIYDLACYFLVSKNWSLFLKLIAKANLFYCLILIGSLFKHHDTLTSWGLFYFLAEIIIIIILVSIELRTALHHSA